MAEVLLVDDDGSVLLTLAIALRRLGHKVTVACDAEQALRHLKEHHYAFLISDVRMPGMSGVELAARASHLRFAPRIVLTSAYSNLITRDDIVEAFMQKPLDLERLHELLCSARPPRRFPQTGQRKASGKGVRSMFKANDPIYSS